MEEQLMDDRGLEDPSELKPTGSPSGSIVVPSATPAREDRPRELSSAELAVAEGRAGTEAVPTVEPQAGARTSVSASGWQRNRQVAGLWATDRGRGSWIYVVDAGWLQLGGTSDPGILALSILGAHARQSQASVDYRTEVDGLVHEIYVW